METVIEILILLYINLLIRIHSHLYTPGKKIGMKAQNIKKDEKPCK